MRWERSWCVILLALGPATVGGFLAGWQQAYGWPGPGPLPCTICDCKDVDYWLSSPTDYGARETTGSPPNIQTHGIPFIESYGSCRGPGTTNAGTFDRWKYRDCNYVCGPPGGGITERVCTDPGAVDATTLTRTLCN